LSQLEEEARTRRCGCAKVPGREYERADTPRNFRSKELLTLTEGEKGGDGVNGSRRKKSTSFNREMWYAVIG